ncbi:hypothetical protein KGF57_001490 [Candida theae]|uniref:SRR1-like domain-containing protein n=1 Tax=Candida theae TaxID=1198502 RepID=A0AAD5BH42_9ASCO|nr:uncharacterized protein KGF57_001490 [Candida theae]KAI5962045.1 hypothetical protein KGF57_001490 [Candida theae]
MERLQLKIEENRSVIRKSEFFNELKATINGSFKCIRCLALGSPSQSSDARYQYALLLELIEYLGVTEISIYDPAFTKEDKELFGGYKIEQKFNLRQDESVLFYIPHLPLEAMEMVLNTEKPVCFLGNDAIAHTDRLTKKKLAELYPGMAILVQYLQGLESDDGFTKVSKNRRRKQFKEPDIVYNFDSVYFKHVDIVRYKHNFNKNDPWGNSFSDLALHRLTT